MRLSSVHPGSGRWAVAVLFAALACASFRAAAASEEEDEGFQPIFQSFPEYYSAFQINGFDGVQSGIGGFLLKPWDERQRTQMELLPQVQARLNEIPGLQVFGFNLPSLPGTGEGLPFQFVINTANDYELLLDVAERVKKRAEESGKFAFLDVNLAFDKPELVVEIDRQKAAQMGVSMQSLGQTLAILLGEGEINRFTVEGRSYKVIAQVEREFRADPGWLNSYYVRNEEGQDLIEYAMLVALIALLCIGAVTAAGGNVKSIFEAVANQITLPT